MALVSKELSNIATTRGTPSSNTAWDKFEWTFSATHLKIIVKQGSTSDLGVSFDGKEQFLQLPAPEVTMNALIYNFPDVNLSRIFFKQVGADIEVLASGVR